MSLIRLLKLLPLLEVVSIGKFDKAPDILREFHEQFHNMHNIKKFEVIVRKGVANSAWDDVVLDVAASWNALSIVLV